MLSDRSYMREDYPREKTSVLIWLLCAVVAGFAIQLGVQFLDPRGGAALLDELKLSVDGIKAGHVWTLLTSGFLHDPEIFFHLGVNLLGLYFIGRELLPILGSRRFLGLYFSAILLGGLTWLTAHWHGLGGSYYGATAGIDALLIAFACFHPNRRMDFLVLFVFPVSLKPKHIAMALLCFDLFGLTYFELRERLLPFDFAMGSSAHLGGMFAGWIYYRCFHDVSWRFPRRRNRGGLSEGTKHGAKTVSAIPVPPLDLTNPSDVRAEVDRILDKINSHGFNALTSAEKRLLDEAKGLLSRP